MIVLHGDYKDLNFINHGVKPAADEGHLPLIWEQFLKGRYNLMEQRIQSQEYFDCYKIFITHYVCETNCYTSYSVVDKTKDKISGYLEHCKGFERKFIDRENNVLVLEQTIRHGKVPASLEELRQRQIKDIINTMERMKKGLQEAREKGDQQLAKVYEGMAMDYYKEIQKWKNKTSSKWFYQEAM